MNDGVEDAFDDVQVSRESSEVEENVAIDPETETESEIGPGAEPGQVQLDRAQTCSTQPYRAPGPGLPESFGWIMLFFGLQFASMIVVLIVAMVSISQGQLVQQELNIDRLLESLSPTEKLIVFTSPAFLSLFILIPLGLFRLSPRPVSRLNFSLPTFSQTLMISSVIVPLAIVGSSVMAALGPVWLQISDQIPIFEALNGMDANAILSQFGDASFLVAIFFIAVVPGVGEEFLFRGVIGRGLVARWGLVVGIGITSLLFAAVHMYPPHVVAIIPMGIALHWTYLMTKSFWAPVMFHFLNNSLATLHIQSDHVEEEPTHWLILVISALYCIWYLYWITQMRTSYQSDEGEVKLPGHEVEIPANVQASRESKTFVLPMIVAVFMLGASLFILTQP